MTDVRTVDTKPAPSKKRGRPSKAVLAGQAAAHRSHQPAARNKTDFVAMGIQITTGFGNSAEIRGRAAWNPDLQSWSQFLDGLVAELRLSAEGYRNSVLASAIRPIS
jgi:hypothetical protein